MSTKNENVLSEKYAIPILKFILDKGRIRKYDLLEVVKSSWAIDKMIPKLKDSGYITVVETAVGKKVYKISLTPKGKNVATRLKRADDIGAGKPVSKGEIAFDISLDLYNKITEIMEEEGKWENVEDFFFDAIKEKIEKRKMESPEKKAKTPSR